MAITLKNPASDIAAAMTGQSIGGVTLTSDENLFYYLLHPMPQGLVVQLLNSAGPAPIPFMGTTRSAFYKGMVEGMVYGMPGKDGFDAAEALARGVAGFLQQLVPTGYVSLFVRDGSPQQLPPDRETQRHVFKVSIEAQYIA